MSDTEKIKKLTEENNKLKELITLIIKKNTDINKLLEDKYNSLLYKLWYEYDSNINKL